MFCLIKSYFCFSQKFQTLSHNACILFSYFCCSLIVVSEKRDIKRILALPYSKKWQKFNKKNKKRSLGYQGMDPEYLTEQTNIFILQLILR